jgi:Icc-related predicted phosphoesterase
MLAFLGDIHGNIEALRWKLNFLKEKFPEVTALIQVGDFGWYRSRIEGFKSINPHIPVYWIDGNHEHFPIIRDLHEVTEVAPNIFYVPRGTVLELDGRKIGFMGGAASVDKEYRLRSGMSWFEDELITDADVAKMDGVDTVDIFVTHTPPQCTIDAHFDPMDLVRYFGLTLEWRDPSAQYVNNLWERFGKPTLICGHMHRSVVDQMGKVRILNIDELFIV